MRIAIDGKTHVPMRVQVFARERASPPFEVGFTSFDPTTPSASVFAFNPPPGTKVTESGDERGAEPPAGRTRTCANAPQACGGRGGRSAADTDGRVVGRLASVVVTNSGRDAAGAAAGSDPVGQLAAWPGSWPSAKVTGTWGRGHLLRGTLFSAC